MKNLKETKRMEKRLVILNPSKFMYESEEIGKFVEMARKELGADCRITFSKEHMAEITRESKEYGLLIAVGGDGTISEIINNMDLENQALAIIPKGTGNGFALDLKIKSIKQAIERIQQGNVESIDLIKVGYTKNGATHEKYCVSTSGLGYIASVVKLAEKKYKGLKALCYPVSSVFTALFNTFGLAMNDSPRVYTNIMVNNTVYAGNFGAFQSARYNDGLMDIFMGNAKPLAQIMNNLSLLTKSFYYRAGMEFQAKDASFELEKPTALMIDGEITEGVNNISYKILKNRLTCVA
jgi:diacylglycerol kinase (ATP)